MFVNREEAVNTSAENRALSFSAADVGRAFAVGQGSRLARVDVRSPPDLLVAIHEHAVFGERRHR